MSRVKRGVVASGATKVLKQAKGDMVRAVVSSSRQAGGQQAGQYAFRDRRAKKRPRP